MIIFRFHYLNQSHCLYL